jgi:hypothetical protein
MNFTSTNLRASGSVGKTRNNWCQAKLDVEVIGKIRQREKPQGRNRMIGKVTTMNQMTIVEVAAKRASNIKAEPTRASTWLQRAAAPVEHHRKKDDPAICEVDDCSMAECFFCKACGVKLCLAHLSERLHPCKQWRRLDYYFAHAHGAQMVTA